MRKQVRLSEADIKNMVSDAVFNILEMDECGPVEEENDDFNEQPVNNVAEGINESGEKSVGGKYGLARKAAKLAREKGRHEQADNLLWYGVDEFNKDHATDGLRMDNLGRVRYIDDKGKAMYYRPGSCIKSIEDMKGYNCAEASLRQALDDNNEIKRYASTAKAYPRKRMMSGLDKIEAVDAAINANEQYKVSETQLHKIIKESVVRILKEMYTGDEPYIPNKYPGKVPKFHSREEYEKWRHEAPDDWFDWQDDRKWQRTGIQPGYSGLATRAMRDRRDGKMSWNNDKNYNRFQTLKNKNGIQ